MLSTIITNVTSALKPGGEAFGTQFLGLTDEARGSYYLYLCSGPAREQDFSHHVKAMSASETYVINVDIERGGYAHDLSSPTVYEKLKLLASKPECLGVLATIPCSTWSPARFVKPGPEPIRNLTNPEGIRDEQGRLPLAAVRANSIAKHCIGIADACAAHGGHFIFENPVGRDASSQFAIPGREQHASLWTLPIMMDFAKRHGELIVHFDQCRTNASTQKTTQLLCSASVIGQVREQLGHLVCNHPHGTHAPIVGAGLNAAGVYATKAAEHFTPELNRRLARALLAPQPAADMYPISWNSSIYSAIAPFTNHFVDSFSYLASAADMQLKVNEEDPHSLLRGIMNGYLELDDAARQDVSLTEVCPIAAHLAGGLEADTSLTHDTWVDAFAISMSKQGGSDNPYYKQAMSGPERTFWRDACDEEMGNLKRNNVYIEVPEDSLPTWNPSTRRSTELVDMMWVLKKKFNELRELLKYKARATIRGDMEKAIDQRLGLPPSETFAPTVRHNTFKLLNATAVVRAAQRETSKSVNSADAKPLRIRSLDVTAAFLQGTPRDDRVRYVRPPEGYRAFDRRGVPIVWEMPGNCYGRTTAPRTWNQTLHTFLITPESKGGLGMSQSDFDPCYYYKCYPDGTRLDCGLYVDDTWVIDDAGALADRDIEALSKRFKITVDNSPKHFLNMNVIVESPTRIKISSEAYILAMADREVPNWRSRPALDMPCTDNLLRAYEKAHLREHVPSKELVRKYGGKVGALVYTSPCVRVDATYAISRLSRALTFPTEELESLADDVIVYLAQTASMGVTFDGHFPNGQVLSCETDSDWAVGHSTTGWAIYLAGAAVAYSSKRQSCIAMSSTEAEIIAASACALELKHFRELVEEMGLPMEAPSLVYVDNSGAVELSRDRKSCHRSRHVDRRYFKVRELAAEGQLHVEHIDTKLNSSDLLTKPLPIDSFTRHRARLLNL